MGNGQVLISGGFTGIANNNVVVPIPIGDFQIYDPQDASWLSIASEEEPAIMTATVRLSDDRYMSVGIGVNDEQLIGAAGMLDPIAQSWTPLPSSTSIRGFPKAALLQDGRVLVTGGLDFSDPTGFEIKYPKETEILDLHTGEWHQAASMNDSAENNAVVPLQDGRVMVVHSGMASGEIYDPDSDSWTSTSHMNHLHAPMTPAAVTLSGGRVLVTGGWIDDATGDAFPIAEIYDPSTDTWKTTKPMTEVRMSHTVTLLPNGQALAAGGVGISYLELHSTTEIFDPTTNRWIPGPDMSEPRFDHTTTLLPDGRLFLFGGITLREDIQEIYPTNSTEFITVPASDE